MIGESDIRAVAREGLGFDQLRPGQEAAASAAADGRDVLAVMPTGAGKSAIYEMAGALRPGPTVVVSPLIALQRDQVDSLDEAGIGRAAEVNSAMAAKQRRATLVDIGEGRVDFIFVSPEQLANPETMQAVREARPGLFVVDEAHCVSSWGHDFRPEYLHLAAAAEAVGRPPILALTATAAPPVRDEIIDQLRLSDPAVIVRGFDRPNIHLAVETHHDADDKRRAALDRITAMTGPGIVYVATRRETSEVAADIAATGLRAAAYHGGLAGSGRDEVRRAFMADELDVVVATTAFGMGIDKANVRFVAHFEISDSVDSYYQEIGRAGRDGSPAQAVLFYRPEDLGLRRFFASGGEVGADVLEAVAGIVAGAGDGASPDEVTRQVGGRGTTILGALDWLAETGWARRSPEGLYAAVDSDPDPRVAASRALEAQDSGRQLRESRVEMMRSYAESRSCRRAFILGYFGEPYSPPCGNCDRCDRGTAGSPATPEIAGFGVGTAVTHREWGPGRVMRIEGGEKLTVLFDRVGYRTLSIGLVEENDLLRVNE